MNIEQICAAALGILIGVGVYRVRVHLAHLKKERSINYTHWDIHALAREMDPGAWAAFDALPELDPVNGNRTKDYVWFAPVKPSFDMAVQALLAGYKAPWPHIWGAKELRKHVALRAVDRAFK
jgi:hypothetical protein